MTYNLTVMKNARGEWIVDPDSGPSMVKVGDIVSWQIVAGETVTAHFQFLEDLFEPSNELDIHWVGVLQPSAALQLTVASKALPDPGVRRKLYGYAVAVEDSNGMHYAIGHNPPPDLDIGD
jgi:hypothetical protein